MKKMKFKLVAAGAAASALAMIAAPAIAGTPVGVSVWGSNATASYVIEGATTGSVAFTATNASTGAPVNMGCASSAFNGSSNVIHGGPNNTVDPVASLGNVTFASCIGPGTAMTVAPCSTWNLEVDDTPTTSLEIVHGWVTNICANVTATPIAAVCNFKVEGAAEAWYNETTGTLTVTEPTGSNLLITAASGCGGAFLAGVSTASFGATYQVGKVNGTTFSAGAINISS